MMSAMHSPVFAAITLFGSLTVLGHPQPEPLGVPEPVPVVDDVRSEVSTVAAIPLHTRALAHPSLWAMAADTSVVGADPGIAPPLASKESKESKESKPAPTIPTGLGFSGIPAINYSSDDGLGLGIIAAAYLNDGVTLPYRTSVTLQIFATTKLVQDHNVVIDTLNVFDLPLRLTARVGFVSSLTQNYCGLGGVLPCDTVKAEAAADDLNLVDDQDDDNDARDQFVGHYFKRRFMNPYGLVNLRYALVGKTDHNPKVEFTGGYRGFYFIPGNLFADDDKDGKPDLFPYPGSLYAQDHLDGEPGFDSVLNFGLMTDSRDNEPAPTEGWWLEGSVRAAAPLWGSTWTWAGFNVTLRGYQYLPLFPTLQRRLVLANRLTVDGVVGDIPTQELARLGGSQDT